jgi:hypothetical protein
MVAQDGVSPIAAAAVAGAAAADTVISPNPGRLCSVLVTVVGANPMQIFDNASAGSGKIIGALAASAPVGTSVIFNMPAANGITVKGSATNPGVTVSYL